MKSLCLVIVKIRPLAIIILQLIFLKETAKTAKNSHLSTYLSSNLKTNNLNLFKSQENNLNILFKKNSQ